MKFFPFTLLLFCFINAFSQITIEPHLMLKRVWFSVDNNPTETIIRIEKNNGIQYGIGLEIGANLNKKLKLSLTSSFSQVGNTGDYQTLNEQGQVAYTEFGSAIHRWNNAVYLSFKLFKNISLGAGGHTIFQPTIQGNFFGRHAIPYGAIEFGLGANLKYTIKRLTISLDSYQGLQNKGGNYYYFDPLRMIGLRLGYPFKLQRN